MILGREENRGISLQQGPEEAKNMLRMKLQEIFPSPVCFFGDEGLLLISTRSLIKAH